MLNDDEVEEKEELLMKTTDKCKYCGEPLDINCMCNNPKCEKNEKIAGDRE